MIERAKKTFSIQISLREFGSRYRYGFAEFYFPIPNNRARFRNAVSRATSNVVRFNCIHLVASSSASRFFSSFLVSVSFFTWARVSSSSALSFGYQLKLTLPIGGGDKSVTRCKYRTKSVLLIRRFSSVVIVVSA